MSDLVLRADNQNSDWEYRVSLVHCVTAVVAALLFPLMITERFFRCILHHSYRSVLLLFTADGTNWNVEHHDTVEQKRSIKCWIQ